MKIDVYDSYATSMRGHVMHFDVFVAATTPAEQALSFGRQWLTSLGEPAEGLNQSRCKYCHSEVANPDVENHIKSHGYFILQMEGCPAPY